MQRFSSIYCLVSIIAVFKSSKENDLCVSLLFLNYSTFHPLVLQTTDWDSGLLQSLFAPYRRGRKRRLGNTQAPAKGQPSLGALFIPNLATAMGLGLWVYFRSRFPQCLTESSVARFSQMLIKKLTLWGNVASTLCYGLLGPSMKFTMRNSQSA